MTIDPNETLRQIRQLGAHGRELSDLVIGPDQSEERWMWHLM